MRCITTLTFLQNLNYVLNTITTKKPDAFVALAGPEILGEGPLFSPVFPSKIGLFPNSNYLEIFLC